MSAVQGQAQRSLWELLRGPSPPRPRPWSLILRGGCPRTLPPGSQPTVRYQGWLRAVELSSQLAEA